MCAKPIFLTDEAKGGEGSTAQRKRNQLGRDSRPQGVCVRWETVCRAEAGSERLLTAHWTDLLVHRFSDFLQGAELPFQKNLTQAPM